MTTTRGVTLGLHLTYDQKSCLDKHFPERQSVMVRDAIRYYCKTRNIDFPDDENKWGGVRRTKKGKTLHHG